MRSRSWGSEHGHSPGRARPQSLTPLLPRDSHSSRTFPPAPRFPGTPNDQVAGVQHSRERLGPAVTSGGRQGSRQLGFRSFSQARPVRSRPTEAPTLSLARPASRTREEAAMFQPWRKGPFWGGIPAAVGLPPGPWGPRPPCWGDTPGGWEGPGHCPAAQSRSGPRPSPQVWTRFFGWNVLVADFPVPQKIKRQRRR